LTEHQPKQPRAIEVVYEPCIWNGTRPKQSVHKHLGYVTYESSEQIRLTPELTFSSEGRQLRLGHEKTINKLSTPKPVSIFLTRSSEKTDIIQIDYEDPFHKEGIISREEAKNLELSTLRLLGYLVQEDKNHIWIAMAIFEYEDRAVDYETVHIIPKAAILESIFLRRSDNRTISALLS